MFLHLENSRNMTKMSFELFLPVKTGTETNFGRKPELWHSKNVYFGAFFIFSCSTVYNHNSL